MQIYISGTFLVSTVFWLNIAALCHIQLLTAFGDTLYRFINLEHFIVSMVFWLS